MTFVKELRHVKKKVSLKVVSFIFVSFFFLIGYCTSSPFLWVDILKQYIIGSWKLQRKITDFIDLSFITKSWVM